MPTLLQINVTSNWGSIGKIAEQIGLCAQAHGWQSYVAYARMSNPSRNRLIKIGCMADVYEHYAEGRFLDNEGLASRRATRTFLKKIDRLRPDIVHLHNLHDHYINYPLLFRYLAAHRIPVVWTQHDQWATTGHCPYNLKGCERWKTECHDCPMSRRWQLDRSRRNFRLKKHWFGAVPSLTVVPVSEWLAGNIRQSLLGNRPIEVIHNGIDLNTFKPQETDVHRRYGIAEGKKIVLGVANVWDGRKGLSDLLSLAALLPREEYALVVVGHVAQKPQVAAEGCQTVWIDRTQNALELAALYSAAAVLLNPTYQDNFPTVNLEALACGTPVITYRTGGSPEAVDAATGAVVEQGDVEGLRAAVLRLAGSDCREACRRRAVEHFDNKACFNQYIALYNKLLSGGG